MVTVTKTKNLINSSVWKNGQTKLFHRNLVF